MRIAQVSGHYPPNFVSGGTLVPQRVARAVAAAGHESLVYAGYLDESRPALTTWSEDDGHGVQVTWLVTTPWTAWDDPHNWDNPEATSAFAAWLEEARPDVVHVHSIQTLGVGVVEAAHRAGAKVVLTMHDFWWLCSRQFLVDDSMRPTSLVTDLGSCPCETGRPELRSRDARVRRALEDVDVILAPSRSAARVFRANGVDPARLRVDENGLPDDQLAALNEPGLATARTGEGPLQLMYAGGAQPMKGFEVLLDAARQVGEHPGLLLDAYGTDEAHVGSLPSWFHRRAAFAPADLRTVLADHDLLVLPSVMRESHSILTREALAAGLGVVCTDTLGPEEAVSDGVNGLVVPAGNAEALAEVLTTLAQDPAAARALTGHGSHSPIRAFSDQARGLLDLYGELTAAAAPQRADDTEEPLRQAQAGLLHRVLFIVGITGAPLRYRAYLPAEALQARGHQAIVRHYRDPELTSLVDQCDAVVLYRVAATTQVLDLISRVKARQQAVPVLYDIDDLIFDPSLRGKVDGLEGMSEAELDLWWHGVERYRTTMEACDGYVGSTKALCEHAHELTGMPAYRFANGVGRLLARASDAALARPRTPGPVRIGYFSGTTTHDADWASIEPAVIEILERHPQVVLRLGGHLEPTPALARFADRVEQLPFVPWYELPKVLRDTDVCLAPLTEGSQFNEAKSAIKWLEAALVETPTVASPTEPFREAVDNGRTGFLASGAHEWVEALETLVTSPATRARLGAHARTEALLTYAPALQGEVYERLLVDAALAVRRDGHREATGWVAVADDEPFAAVDAQLDPYAVPEGHAQPPARPSAVGRYARRGLDVLRTEGAPALGRRAVAFLRRRLARYRRPISR